MSPHTDKELLDDLRHVTEKIGKSPTIEEYRTHGDYSCTTYYRRFGGWNDAKAAAGLEQHSAPKELVNSEEELLNDLRRVAEKIGKSPTQDEYSTHGDHSPATLSRRFGGWNGAKDAAGLAKNRIFATDGMLLDDLERVADEVGKSPTMREYYLQGRYNPDTINQRFDGWNNAKDAAGLARNKDFDKTDEDLLKDLRRVAEKIGKSPTAVEYTIEGEHHYTTLESRFDGWNNAKDAAGLARNTDFDYSNEDLLKHIREKGIDAKINTLRDFFQGLDMQSHTSRFDLLWEPFVRAGLKPTRHAPLSETEYDSYIQTAINASHPSVALYGLLRAFTGIPKTALYEFDLDWVSRIDSEFQPPLITVPSEHISTDKDWELILPKNYTTKAGDKKSTQLKPLLQWIDNTGYTVETCPDKRNTFAPTIIIDRADLNATPGNLRATVATHLARQERSRFEIDMQVGMSKTNWRRSVEDYFLYLYQFEDRCHPEYEPSGIYLDPDTGKVREIESQAE